MFCRIALDQSFEILLLFFLFAVWRESHTDKRRFRVTIQNRLSSRLIIIYMSAPRRSIIEHTDTYTHTYICSMTAVRFKVYA